MKENIKENVKENKKTNTKVQKIFNGVCCIMDFNDSRMANRN